SDELSEVELVDAIGALAAERPAGDPAAAFERASARDSAGLETEAEPLYRAALAGGLDAVRRPRAVIQLASTLRLLGRLDESRELLEAELERAGEPDALTDETRAFLALTLLAAGEPERAAALALTALAPHLSRYNRAVEGNAAELAERQSL
ncbi:MAG TPA: tetratricopeptide repeat protein, partial [Gaiellaceae bacterium]|nr:tetratricopeptide repeat protein [Gaiellaceae bacterium]